jgi:hypothetical protein
MLSQNPTVVWAIAVSPKDRKGDRSALEIRTVQDRPNKARLPAAVSGLTGL